MALIGTLVSFTAGTKIVSADVNSNFAAIRNAFNSSAVLNDTANTITVTHTFTVSQTFSGGFTVASGQSITASGVTISGKPTLSQGVTVTSGQAIVASGVQIAGGLVSGLFVSTGGIGLGTAPLSQQGFRMVYGLSGSTTQTGILSNPTFDSSATNTGYGINIAPQTAAAAFTAAAVIGLHLSDVSLGVGSAITTQYGLLIDSQTKGGTNYAIFTNSGLVKFGDNVTCSASLNVVGAIICNSLTVSSSFVQQGTLLVSGAFATGSTQFINTSLSTASSNDLTIFSTFNSPGNDLTSFRIAVTDTASASGAKIVSAAVGGNTIFKVPKEGGVITQLGTLATNTTRGFLYIPTMPATASGTPVAETGTVALAYETTGNHLMVYNGAWKQVALA